MRFLQSYPHNLCEKIQWWSQMMKSIPIITPWFNKIHSCSNRCHFPLWRSVVIFHHGWQSPRFRPRICVDAMCLLTHARCPTNFSNLAQAHRRFYVLPCHLMWGGFLGYPQSLQLNHREQACTLSFYHFSYWQLSSPNLNPNN